MNFYQQDEPEEDPDDAEGAESDLEEEDNNPLSDDDE